MLALLPAVSRQGHRSTRPQPLRHFPGANQIAEGCEAIQRPRQWRSKPSPTRNALENYTSILPLAAAPANATDKSQVTPRRVPTSSRRAARSATPSRPAAATRSAPRSTASSAARRAPSTATPTLTPTSRRASPGTRTPSSSTSRTPRSTSPAPRWPLAVSRRTRTGTTSSRTFRVFRVFFFPVLQTSVALHCRHVLTTLCSYLKEATA